MLSKLRRWLREGLILLALLAGAMLLMDVWRAPQLPGSLTARLCKRWMVKPSRWRRSARRAGAALFLGELVRRLPLHDAGSRQAAFGRGKRDDHCVTLRQ